MQTAAHSSSLAIVLELEILFVIVITMCYIAICADNEVANTWSLAVADIFDHGSTTRQELS